MENNAPEAKSRLICANSENSRVWNYPSDREKNKQTNMIEPRKSH